MLGLAVRVAWVRGVVRVGVWVYVPHRKTSGRTLVSPSGYSPEPRSSTALGHAVSAEGDMITSAIGFAHGSVAIVRASSQAILGTVTCRAPPAALAHTGGSTSSQAQSLLGQSLGWMARGLMPRSSTSFVSEELDSTSARNASGPSHSQ